jgi:[amino group carrier protein]-lysine/ornithine hydrolase
MSELITELVKRYSPSEQEAEAVQYLTEWMGVHGFSAWIDEAGNACGLRGNTNAPKTLIMLGHIDTYPGFIEVRTEDGILYGRGSVDAKGSLCAFAEAASQAEIPAGWRVIVVGAVEEECATSKGARHIAANYKPDLCLIGEPSGVDRITLGYKGRLLIDLEYERPASHTARPEPSAGAIGAAFWQSLLAWTESQNAGIEKYFDQIMPNLRAINTSSDDFNERVELTVSFRLPPQWNPAQVIEAIAPFVPEGATLRTYGGEIAIQSGKDNPVARGLLAAIRARGERPGFVLKTGTSDMNVVGAVWDCPIVAYGPGDSNLDHTPNEHLPLAEYEAAIKTLVHFIEHLPAQD